MAGFLIDSLIVDEKNSENIDVRKCEQNRCSYTSSKNENLLRHQLSTNTIKQERLKRSSTLALSNYGETKKPKYFNEIIHSNQFELENKNSKNLRHHSSEGSTDISNQIFGQVLQQAANSIYKNNNDTLRSSLPSLPLPSSSSSTSITTTLGQSNEFYNLINNSTKTFSSEAATRLLTTAMLCQASIAAVAISYRKPKRIRTAFSPSQLIDLEKAFEENHYVVGQERKLLAQELNLSETQVKVWFQNRRTKEKRLSGTDDEENTDASGNSQIERNE
ncbi:hypothetical protein SNEBB_010936 [Seison nebaliae]|nr:hypothetical protein SNEBB_010936 [Seison nebaliae]